MTIIITKRNSKLKCQRYKGLLYHRIKGDCLSCNNIERILDVSFVGFVPLGLKSHIRQTFSHSEPGFVSSRSAMNCSSSALKTREICRWECDQCHPGHRTLSGHCFTFCPTKAFYYHTLSPININNHDHLWCHGHHACLTSWEIRVQWPLVKVWI